MEACVLCFHGPAAYKELTTCRNIITNHFNSSDVVYFGSSN